MKSITRLVFLLLHNRSAVRNISWQIILFFFIIIFMLWNFEKNNFGKKIWLLKIFGSALHIWVGRCNQFFFFFLPYHISRNLDSKLFFFFFLTLNILKRSVKMIMNLAVTTNHQTYLVQYGPSLVIWDPGDTYMQWKGGYVDMRLRTVASFAPQVLRSKMWF